MKYCVTINDKRYEVEVEKGNAAIVSKREVALGAAESKKLSDTQAAATVTTPEIVKPGEQRTEEVAASGKEVVKAPMAGGIIDVKVSVGSVVKKGDILLLLEAMKMENEITAPVDGIVAEIKAHKGTVVSADDVLVVLK